MLIKRGKQHIAKSFNFTYRYIDDILSLNNSKFSEYIYSIYLAEFEIKQMMKIASIIPTLRPVA